MDPVIYQQRCQALANSLPHDGAILCFSGKTASRNSDVTYPFRSNSNMLYLSGCNVPDHCLVGIKTNHQQHWYLIAPKITQHDIIWHGSDLPKNFPTAHYDAILSPEELDELLSDRHIFIPSDQQHFISQKSSAIDPYLNKMRSIKSTEELDYINDAIYHTIAGFAAVMSKRDQIEHETQALSIYLGECMKRQCFEQAYQPIIAGHHRANILHYTANNQAIPKGSMLLMDAGIEYQYYAADISRTFPTQKHFSSAQSKLYDVVLHAQIETLSALKSGLSWMELNHIAKTHLAQGLIDLKITNECVEDVIHNGTLSRYYPHGIGHSVGLDVHDTLDEKNHLKAGMVITVEPGLYCRPHHHLDEKWHNIGIRIEDTVVITENGHINLSDGLPKSIEDIEALS